MATRKTLDFLPSVFHSNANKKFLRATLDQLVSEPSYKRLDGFIGRKFSPTFRSGDNYVVEPTQNRSNYQLEPSVIVKNISNEIDFYSDYTDLVSKIGHYGGVNNDHSRLFASEYYSYNPKIELDKLVNFTQYYWLPSGPDAVLISSYTLSNDSAIIEIDVNLSNLDSITVARGHTYNFSVNNAGHNIWIQTEPGISGFKQQMPEVSSRRIYGVSNNGEDVGTITFAIPLSEAQDYYFSLPLINYVDYAITNTFTSVDGKLISEIVQFDGDTEFPVDKYVIFLNNSTNSADWTNANDDIVAVNDRYGIWKIQVDELSIVSLVHVRDFPMGNRVRINDGATLAGHEFFKNTAGLIVESPPITAPLSTLYFQDAADSAKVKTIHISDIAVTTLDIDHPDSGIIGQKEYTSYSGGRIIKFSNGLTVKFDDTVEPIAYRNKTYIVEGVGVAITLVDIDTLTAIEVNPEGSTVPFSTVNFDIGKYDETLSATLAQDYIVINRASDDLNAWSRSNRWFHIDIILNTAAYNGTIPLLDQYQRATRPIIEFDKNLQLFNNGRVAMPNVDQFDMIITASATQVENVSVRVLKRDFGLNLQENETIIFGNDIDLTKRKNIYSIAYIAQYSATFFDSTTERDPAIFYGTVTTIAGSVVVIGQFTKFLTELEKGAFIYYSSGYDQTASDTDSYDTPRSGVIGRVKHIYSNTKLQLEEVALTSEDRINFDYNHPRISLVRETTNLTQAQKYSSVLALSGTNAKTTHWFNVTASNPGFWLLSQQKIKINQAPLFDIIDNNDISFGDTDTYPLSNFTGTKIFSFYEGIGKVDPVLNFALSYTNVGNSLGDINFKNNFDNDHFVYTSNRQKISKLLADGFIRENFGRTAYQAASVWTTVQEKSKQYQHFSYGYTGATKYFEIDILPVTPQLFSPNIKVFVNTELVINTVEYEKYSIETETVGVKNALKFATGYLMVGDTIDILIYSNQVSSLGYYQIPVNLDSNSKNELLNEVTLGQMRNHLLNVGQNTIGLEGQILASNNSRDIYTRATRGSIIQNSAPTMYSSLFLIDSNLNFMNGLELASREYSKFKNKFLELCISLTDLNPSDAATGVDTITSIINTVKNSTFSWYYSDMVPAGENYTVLNPGIVNVEIDISTHKYVTTYALNEIYNSTALSSRAILVYYNGQQLIINRDYIFNTQAATLIITDAVDLVIGEKLEIRDYSSTDGSFVPETPTKLGLHPKYIPGIYLDNTYQTPVQVIQGHDGSLTPAFGDFRDDYLLELESRIYNNIKAEYNTELIDLSAYIPGKFRNTEYSLSEFNTVLNSEFLKWIGGNKIDYSANPYFQPNNEFSWNYSRSLDKDDQPLIGYWRGIYKYFYDTDRPHSHPWEMLGFTVEPSWWISRYGTAPYTSQLLNLWLDLEDGYNYETDSINPLYARPGLSSILPVDVNGDLVKPSFLIGNLDSGSLNYSFAIGDQGPVESAWRRTSEFAYALQRTISLLKPAVYFGTLFDTSRYSPNLNINQFILNGTNKKVSPRTIIINGELVSGKITRASGYLNWITDYLTSFGINATAKVRTYLNALDVNLSHKMAGFTDKKYITVLAEQYSPNSTNESTIIPDENYTVYLNKSVPVKRINYSAVIVERTDSGYTVSGYNLKSPYFTIIPSQSAGRSYVIEVLTTRGIIYKDYQNKKITVPYGYEFKNKQQVVDFLVSYQRILIAQGFVFENYSQDLNKNQDWVLAAEEFLTWSLQGWKSGNILVLSPIASELVFTSSDSVVDIVGNRPNESRILNPNFEIIRNNSLDINRESNVTTISVVSGQTIAFAELTLVQYDHALIFDNVTVFNDVIYKPELGNRQYRLKLAGNKTSNWNGELNPAGFIYNSAVTVNWAPSTDYKKGDIVSYKTRSYTAMQDMTAADTFDFNYWSQLDRPLTSGLLPNLSNNAAKLADIYNIDLQPLDENFDTFSNGLIGYRSRPYLEDIGMNQTTQSKFYQGYIREKGTQNAISAIANGQFNNQSSKLTTYEEWAMRVGEYGALEVNQSVSVQLDETKYRSNPATLSLLRETDASISLVNAVRPYDLLSSPLKYNPSIFLNRPVAKLYENDIKSAGYVNIADVDTLLFDITNYSDLSALLPKLTSGYKIWVAKDFNKDWQVYRVTKLTNPVIQIDYALDNKIKVTMTTAHGLVVGDVFAFSGLDSQFDNFYQVFAVENTTSVIVLIDQSLISIIRKQCEITGSGNFFDLAKMRYSTVAQISSNPPKHGWRTGDMAWIDSDQDGKWTVLKYTP